jgi:hypothetical protein
MTLGLTAYELSKSNTISKSNSRLGDMSSRLILLIKRLFLDSISSTNKFHRSNSPFKGVLLTIPLGLYDLKRVTRTLSNQGFYISISKISGGYSVLISTVQPCELDDSSINIPNIDKLDYKFLLSIYP